jgi:hypothetical protein
VKYEGFSQLVFYPASGKVCVSGRGDPAINTETKETNMNLQEIKSAVESGKVVCWGNRGYKVIKDNTGQWLVRCEWNGYCFGLYYGKTDTLNGKESEFFVQEVAP